VIRVCGLVTIASEVTAGVLDVTMSFHDCVVLFKLALPRSCALTLGVASTCHMVMALRS
jgi:hypothetical protein